LCVTAVFCCGLRAQAQALGDASPSLPPQPQSTAPRIHTTPDFQEEEEDKEEEEEEEEEERSCCSSKTLPLLLVVVVVAMAGATGLLTKWMVLLTSLIGVVGGRGVA
jgi:hypothetical protein